MSDPQDILRRRALEYHSRPDRRSSCGNMALDMDLLFSGFLDFAKDGRLELTEAGTTFLAIGDRSREAAETGTGSVHESPGAGTAIAQPLSE